MKWMTWHECIDMNQRNEFKRMNWNEAIDSNELNWMNEITDLTWINWHEWIETKNWTEWLDMNELKWMNWNEKLNWMTWHEWVEMNDLKGMNCQKCSEPLSFFKDFLWHQALATVSCTFCRPLSGSRRAHPRKQTPSGGEHGRPLYTKTHRVLRPSVFSAVNSRVPDRSHFPTSWWWCDWHDDVVDMMIEMMMRLPWWWDS